jgi:AcrR family transcriptional regulator
MPTKPQAPGAKPKAAPKSAAVAKPASRPTRKSPRQKRQALHARKAPQQERSQAMVAVILAAATRVLRKESLAGFNTNRVAEVAGVSVGSLYQYFPNKAALIAALIEETQAALANAVEAHAAALRGQSLMHTLHAMAHLAIQQQYGDAQLAAALDHEEKRLPLEGRVCEAQQRVRAAVHALLAAHLPTLPTVAAQDCIAITKALVEADADGSAQAPQDLQHLIVCALAGYLERVCEVA